MRAIQDHPDLELKLLVFGAHLSPQFGMTVNEISAEGFQIDEQIECLISSDTDVGMARTIGLATLSLADSLGRMRPDMLLIIADRYEMMAAATVALALRIPIAHIEGGEISAGAIDDAIRNALTKMSHLHLTPHDSAANRVASMGEAAWRISVCGAPSLDHLRELTLWDSAQLIAELELPESGPLLLIAVHPVTLLSDTVAEIDALFEALEQLGGRQVFCFPNADSGSHQIINQVERWVNSHSEARLFVNLPALAYFSLMNAADVMLGNSSSAIMEAASFKLPVINIGLRQQGRLCAHNIISIPADRAQIIEQTQRALSDAFGEGLADLHNPYGDGHASQRIVRALAECPLGDQLLLKEPQ